MNNSQLKQYTEERIRAYILVSFVALFITYSLVTVSSWDVDNNFPWSGPPVTLSHWIYVNQIQHVWKMFHEIW